MSYKETIEELKKTTGTINTSLKNILSIIIVLIAICSIVISGVIKLLSVFKPSLSDVIVIMLMLVAFSLALYIIYIKSYTSKYIKNNMVKLIIFLFIILIIPYIFILYIKPFTDNLFLNYHFNNTSEIFDDTSEISIEKSLNEINLIWNNINDYSTIIVTEPKRIQSNKSSFFVLGLDMKNKQTKTKITYNVEDSDTDSDTIYRISKIEYYRFAKNKNYVFASDNFSYKSHFNSNALCITRDIDLPNKKFYRIVIDSDLTKLLRVQKMNISLDNNHDNRLELYFIGGIFNDEIRLKSINQYIKLKNINDKLKSIKGISPFSNSYTMSLHP